MKTRLTILFTLLGSAIFFGDRSAFGAAPDNQPQQYVQQQWGARRGLPANAVQSVLQTRDGRLWAATERGLSCFDGSRFRNFDRSNTPAFSDNYVGALFEAQDGTLWIGTGLNGLIAYRDGVFQTVRLPISGQQGKIDQIRQDPSGAIWLGTSSHGLLRWQNGSIRAFGKADGLAGPSILSLLIDHDGVVWAATSAGGLQSWNGQKFISRVGADLLPGRQVSALFQTPENKLWIGSEKCLFTLDPRQGSSSLLRVATSRKRILVTRVDPGAIWLGTETGGLELHHGSGTSYFDPEHGFDIDTVQALFTDREGSLWVGTEGAGLIQLRVPSFKSYTDAKLSSANHIRALAAGDGTSIWIGTDHGLRRWSNGESRPVALKPQTANQDFRALLNDHEGSLWIGTDGGGLYRLRHGSTSPQRIQQTLPSPVIMALAEDSLKEIWIGTPNGLSRLSHGQLTTYTTRDGLPADVVLAILADRSGRLWLGTSHGLASMLDGKLTSYGPANGIPDDTVLSLCQDSTGAIWIGTFDGLFRWSGKEFQRWTTGNGLFSNVVTDIAQSEDGSLWLRSHSEISRVDRNDLDLTPSGELHAVKHDEQDGILTTVSGGGSPGSLRLNDGTLWFGSHRGLLTVNPKQLQSSSLPPPILISDMFIDGRNVSPSSTGAFPPGRGNLEFHFSALSFIDHDNLLYKYRLDGFDKEWIAAGSRTTAYYTNIPPGTYTFRVIAANRDGLWNQQGTFYTFQLRSHLYQTSAFLAACALLSLIVAVIVIRAQIRLREQKLLIKQLELEEVVSQRTDQLEAEKKQLLIVRENLKDQARKDGMTGLLNRSAILLTLEQELSRASRKRDSLALVIMDIDHFKNVNDTHGHLVGDEVIRQVSQLLQRSVPSGDIVGRYGGEEFLLLLCHWNSTRHADRLEHLRRSLAVQLSIQTVQGEPISVAVTCSFGVSLSTPTDPRGAETLLASADLALYEAKRSGRNRVVFSKSVGRIAAATLASLPGDGTASGVASLI